ncbi:histone-lysine N-methyltransferase SETD1B-A-like [Dendronephthya gigantea]|uniref:histone-lysine N-methyltransferase SETD1B-A-like n=1 Tax=Dendronephthya gigantea TaxID=151771 RepID=UPI001068DD6E|nr:histone-lysine N-methyltransferase SETD1B-A-like [Dendronephthya gigantea]
MSNDPSAYIRHRIGDLSRVRPGQGHSLGANSIPNGEHRSRPNEAERKRNYKLIIDPVLKGRGHQKIYRFDGEFDGQAAVIPKDPRSRRTRLWSTRTKADLPIPKFKIDKFYVGIPPQRDVILTGLNDNVDKKFLQDICDKFGNIEGIKIFYDPVTKRHSGKARVGFTTSASAKLAVAKLDGTSIMGCIVHADFEHKVEVKHLQKSHPPARRTSDPVNKTPPSIDRIPGHHVIPTPPPSNSSPSNSTPSTPGLGLADPRRRNSGSVASTSGDKHQGRSPSTWPTPLTQQNKVPVFEPISPPSEKLPLPPPPPPDAPPPPLPEKCRTPSPIPSTTKQDRYQNKDSKSLSKGSRDSHKSRQHDEAEWRRRDWHSGRDRYDYGSYRRSSTDERGRDSRDSRYSSNHRDYYPREKERDNYTRNELRRSSFRESEGRRSRDSDDSYGSEKSSKSSKDISKGRYDYENKDSERTRSPRPRSDVYERDKRDAKKPDKQINKSEEISQKKDRFNISDTNLNNGKASGSPFNTDSLSLKSLSPRTEKQLGLGTDVLENLDSQSSVQENYLPMVEDISPVSSPTHHEPMNYVSPNCINPPIPTTRMPSPHDQRPVRKKLEDQNFRGSFEKSHGRVGDHFEERCQQKTGENSAFKALEGWWDNTQKLKLKKPSPSETTTAPSNQTPTTSLATDMTSPFTSSFSTTMSQGGMLGLRASLPKMPSFRKRRPPSTSGSDLYSKRQRTESRSEREQKRIVTDSDSDAPGKLKRKRQDDWVNDDVSVGSPWQPDDDVVDEPPATSVRTEEKHSSVGSTLYTNIYSSLSESESSQSGDESGSEESGDDDSDWNGSQRSHTDSEEGDDEETGKDAEDIFERKIPQTPPGTPPKSPPTSPAVSGTPSNASITPTASPIDVTTVDDEGSRTEDTSGLNMLPQDKEGSLGTPMIEESEQEKAGEVGILTSDAGEEGMSEASSIATPHKHIPGKVESTSEESAVDFKTPQVTQGGEELPVSKETPPEPVEEPVIELPPEFPLRSYWQDDRLVYDFLVSGLDYEDASYMKIGFENLCQVGSDSVANARWSFHPTTSPGVTKGRNKKVDNCGVRILDSGSARCEGFYKISMKEKAKYLEAARRQVEVSAAVVNKKDNEKEANKAKQQSRENRALQRRLAASFQLEDFGDILKFNQLKVRKKKLTFCKSRIHDWGLFALEPIARDEMVIEYVGEVVRQAIADDREKRYERLGIGSSYLFRVDSDTIIDATKYGNLARFINHCCDPNCYAKVVTFESEKKIVIYSKRDIAVNEEITYDYKFPIEDEKIPCLCGAAQCRGTLN